VPAGNKRQRPHLCLKGVRQGVPDTGPQADPQEALHAPHQRQGEEVHSDPVKGVGLHNGLAELRKRNQWLPSYVAIYNHLRKNSAIGWLSPQERLTELLC